MDKQLIFPMEEKYQEYLIDESKFSGSAQSISFPENEKEIVEIVRLQKEASSEITIQSGKTGIAGGAVPVGGHIMNLSLMKKCKEGKILEDGTALLTVETGINLMELNKEIGKIFKKTPMLWPPQPTELSAAVGGILASNAKGINACHYGDSRQYIEAIRLVCSDGTVQVISRFEHPGELDMILGGEGIYGVITEAVLRLLPKPEGIWGISFFFQTQEDSGAFAEKLKCISQSQEAYLNAAEYIDRSALDLIEIRKSTMTKIKDLPDVQQCFSGMVYVELAGKEEGIEELAECLMETAMECGSNPDDAWAVSGENEVEKMRAFRHGAAETANLYIEDLRRKDKRIMKQGTDMALGNMPLAEALSMYRSDMENAGVKGCIFGHIWETHLHVNLLPLDFEQYERGRELISGWAAEAARRGGCAAAEHGIGKLKIPLRDMVFTQEQQEKMKRMKQQYDPVGLWNRGNIFKQESLI